MSLTRSWFRARHETVVLSCVLMALLYVPVPLGSNRPHAWLGLEIYVFGVMAFWALGALCYSEYRKTPEPVARILAVLLAWLLFVLLQTVVLPESMVEGLNPAAYSLQKNLNLISVDAKTALSIDRGSTYNEFLKYCAYAAIFYLILCTVTTKARLMWSVGLVIFAGIMEAVFGIYAYLTGFVIFPETNAANELRAGTFVNRNHFANLLTMVLCLVLGLLASIINSRDPGRGSKLGRYNDLDSAIFLVLVGASLILLAAVFTSGSRAPVVFFTISFGIMLILARAAGRTGRGELVLAPVVLVGLSAAIVVMGFDQSMIRLLDRDIFGGERMLQNMLGLELLSSVWLTGVGAGNYRWAFTMFRDDNLRFVTYDHAHNDYLEVAIEQGIVGAVLLAIATGLVVRELYRGYKARRNPLIRGVIFGCLMSVIYMLLHALVEFNFRIPANAVYFFALSALGVAACRIDRQQRRPRSRRVKEREIVNG